MTIQGTRKYRPSTYVKIDDERYLKLRYWQLTTAVEITYGATITLHREGHRTELLGHAYQGTSRDNAFVVTEGLHTIEKTHDLPRAACRLYDRKIA